MLTLIQLLAACGVDVNLDSYKVHLAYSPASSRALDDYLAGRFKEYQEHQTRRNFECDHVIGLVGIGKDRWLFAGAYEVLAGSQREPDHYHYDTELLPGQEDLVGRVIVRHRRAGRHAYIRGKSDGLGFDVSAFLEEPLSLAGFPGYRQVSMPFTQLKSVVAQSIDAWKAPLSSVKGVYVITDQATGALYVGSATGDGGLWQRWEAYAQTGHGGNVGLKRALAEHGRAYAESFRFTVLEVADLYATDNEIVARELYWKDALGSRAHGYNEN